MVGLSAARTVVLGEGATGVNVGFGGVEAAWLVVIGGGDDVGDDVILVDVVCGRENEALGEDIGDDGTVVDEVFSELLEVYQDKVDGTSTLEDEEDVETVVVEVVLMSDEAVEPMIDGAVLISDAVLEVACVDIDVALRLVETLDVLVDIDVVFDETRDVTSVEADSPSQSVEVMDGNVDVKLVL